MPSIILSKSIKHPNTFSISKGETKLVSEVRSINQSIRLILTTSRGELFGDPDFGCRLQEYLFDFVGDNLSMAVREEIVSVLQRYEPRIIIGPEDITTETDNTTVYINLSYRIRYTDYRLTYSYKVPNYQEDSGGVSR